MLNIFLYNFITPPLTLWKVAEGRRSVLINIYCHSAFLHLVTYIEVIKVYVKMKGIFRLLKPSKEPPLPQSPSLRGTCYKVDSIISS